MNRMVPGNKLGETGRRIGRLAQMAGARARADASRLAPAAASAASRLATARREAKSAQDTSERLGWIPLIGRIHRQRSRSRAGAVQQIEEGIRALRRKAEDLREVERLAASLARRSERVVTFAATAPRPHDDVQRTLTSLLSRTTFLERDASSGQTPIALLRRAEELIEEAGRIAGGWSEAPPPSPASTAPAQEGKRSRTSSGPESRGQMILDLSGTGERFEEPRIWLPVSASRTREMLERGARIDRSAPKRGSQLWIPVSEREKVNDFLPLAFRAQKVHLHYPPIKHNAIGSNLHQVFDRASWSHIRTAAYDRAGHRCQLCGKQGGSLWNRMASKEEKSKGGVVDCHEVWEWTPSEIDGRVGIQRLSRLLVLCKDCHMSFHDSYALWKAGQVGLEDQAGAYLHSLRCLANRSDSAEMAARMASDREEHAATRGIQKWVLDLSHLAVQDYMSDHSLTLQSGNKAGVGPDRIGGISFSTEDGTAFAAVHAEDLANGAGPRPIGGITAAHVIR